MHDSVEGLALFYYYLRGDQQYCSSSIGHCASISQKKRESNFLLENMQKNWRETVLLQFDRKYYYKDEN